MHLSGGSGKTDTPEKVVTPSVEKGKIGVPICELKKSKNKDSSFKVLYTLGLHCWLALVT